MCDLLHLTFDKNIENIMATEVLSLFFTTLINEEESNEAEFG